MEGGWTIIIVDQIQSPQRRVIRVEQLRFDSSQRWFAMPCFLLLTVGFAILLSSFASRGDVPRGFIVGGKFGGEIKLGGGRGFC
jgi:hypothetical protein